MKSRNANRDLDDESTGLGTPAGILAERPNEANGRKLRDYSFLAGPAGTSVRINVATWAESSGILAMREYRQHSLRSKLANCENRLRRRSWRHSGGESSARGAVADPTDGSRLVEFFLLVEIFLLTTLRGESMKRVLSEVTR